MKTVSRSKGLQDSVECEGPAFAFEKPALPASHKLSIVKTRRQGRLEKSEGRAFALHRVLQSKIATFLLFLCTLLYPVLSYSMTTEVQCTEEQGVLSFHSDTPKAFTVRQVDKEIIITVDTHFDEKSLQKLVEADESWIQQLDYGYDTLVMRPPPSVSAELHTSTYAVTITLTLTQPKAPVSPPPNTLPVRLAQVRSLTHSKEIRQGLGILDDLEGLHPREPAVFLAKAHLAREIGRNTQALAYLDQVDVLQPDHLDARLLRKEIDQEEGSFLRAEHEWRHSKGLATEHISKLFGEMALSRGSLYLGTLFATNYAKTDPITRTSGVIKGFRGRRTRSEAFLRYITENDHEVTGSLFFGDGVCGGGAEYLHLHLNGKTKALVEVFRPNWDHLASVVNIGKRSRLEIGRTFTGMQKWFASGACAVNHFAVQGCSDVATTLHVLGTLRYYLRACKPSISIGYTFDGEYLLSENRKRDVEGNLFNAILFSEREIHSFDTLISYCTSNGWAFEAIAGYAFNRLGDHAPIIGCTTTYKVNDSVEGKLSAERSFDVSENSDRVDRMVLSLLLRW